MNVNEFQALNSQVVPKVQSKLDTLADGNVIVELQNNQHFNNTTVYGISSVDSKPPYEAYELYNDGNTATWKYLGMTQ